MERFFAKVEKTETCWNWKAYLNKCGYGVFRFTDKIMLAHRFSVMLSGRSVTPWDVIMHSCDNPKCVNPAHLEIGTLSQNMTDAWARGRKKPSLKKRTHCAKGHDLLLVGEYKRGSCKQCGRDRSAARSMKN